MGSSYVAMHYAGNQARRHISTHRAKSVIEALGLTEGRVLDVGCGPGFSSVLLARRVPRVTALDIDPAKLRIAQRLADLNGVRIETVEGNASSPLPFPDAHFDGLVSLELIEHIPDWRGLVAEMCRVVRPGGRIAISTPGRLGIANFTKVILLKLGIWKETTYEYFIPRRALIRELARHGVDVTQVKHVVLTAPMTPDAAMPVVRVVERLAEGAGPLSRTCSTSIYCGVKRGGH